MRDQGRSKNIHTSNQPLGEIAKQLAVTLRPLSGEKRVSRILDMYADTTVVATSFGPTSAVMLHMASQIRPGIRVVQIRHRYETEGTLKFAQDCQRRFQIDLKVFDAPRLKIPEWDSHELDEFCRLVKVEPMRRALAAEGAEIWIAGLIHSETAERRTLLLARPRLGAIAVYPILDWTLQDTIAYCDAFGLKLNDDYFDPCKGPEQKLECGLHFDRDNRSLRIK